MTNYRNILFDLLVHAQDIAIPLVRVFRCRPRRRGPVPTGVRTMRWPFWERRRLGGLRLFATETDWSAGAGVELRGPIGMLLLLLTGRTRTALPYLSGQLSAS